jgi:uncharacterized protein (TIGR03437 family)
MKYPLVAICVGASCIVSFAQERQNEVDDQQAAREEWFYSQREYPLSQIPAGARLKAIADIKAIEQTMRSRRQTASAARHALGASIATSLDAATWTSIGPKPTDGGSTYVTAGRVNAVAIDPRDNNTVYLGAAEGGVWKTTDGGVSWTPLTDNEASLATGAIAIDPANPDTVYVGTGEENFAQDSYYGAGILKSTDAGNSWTNIVGPFLRDKIGALAISPADSQTLLCSSAAGIFRSTDGGATWTNVLPGTGTSVLFDPTNGDIAYAALGNINGNAINGVYRSTDGGQNWTRLRGSGASALPSTNVGRIEIAISPSTPTTLYVGIQRSPASAGNLLGIYKTTDSGATWGDLRAPDVCASVPQCWYDLTVRVHPKNPDIVFAAGSLSIIRTMNGGSTWNQINRIGPNQVEIHVDEHYLAFTPDGTKLFIANDGGVYSTTDVTNSVVSWTELNNALAITQFYPGASIDPTNTNIGFGGAQDNGTQRYDGSPNWTGVTCGDGGFTAIDPALPSIAYVACTSLNNPEIQWSSTNGNNWMSAQYGGLTSDRSRTLFIPPMVGDPSNPQTLYFGTYRLWQTRDGAGKWIAISGDLTGGPSTGTVAITAIAVAPSDPNTVYVGTNDSILHLTNNALNGANAAWTDRSVGLPIRSITHIAVSPIDPATAYVTFSGFSTSPGHVFKTANSGASWTDISGNLPNLPVNDLVVDPDIPDTLYIGTDAGVMVTTDGGATWTTLGNGLPRVVVDSLVLQRASRTLRAATHGRSMWDILVPLPSKSVQPVINSLSPNGVNAGGAGFSISVLGANFATGAVLRWNGSSRPTTVVDGTHLTTQISAADIALVGRNTVDVFSPSRGVGVSNSMNFNIGPAPATSSQAFVNSAYGPAVAPGSLATLYGTNLAGPTVLADAAPPWPVNLGGTSMTVGNTNAPLYYVSPGQINFQVPYFTISRPTATNLTVTEGTFSTSVTVTVTPYAPGLYTTNSQGSGQAAAIIAGTASIVAPTGAFAGSRPAQKGEFISLYCTGLGAVSNRPPLGSPSPSAPLATTTATPTVTVGSVDAPVKFSGLAPGYVGLYQVNIQVPDAAPSGDAVPVILSIGGATANTVTIAVQ